MTKTGQQSPDTARALYAPGHDGFYEWANVLVLYRTFSFQKSAPITSKHH